MKASIVAFVAVALCSAAAVAEKTEKERIAAGEIILITQAQEGSDVPVIIVKGTVDAPPARVWPYIENCNGYKDVMPHMAESEELERKGNKVKCRTQLEAPWPVKDLEATTWAEHVVVPGKKWTRTWTLDSGDYDSNTGSWTLTPYGDGSQTYIVYKAVTKPQTSVPGFLRKIAQNSALPDIIENLREAVAKEAAKKKD